MPVTLIVGTDKGGMLLRADDDREQWEVGELGFPGWRVTAAARDATGRTYLGVALESFGNAVLVSDDLVHWEQLEAAPRYEAGDVGNADLLLRENASNLPQPPFPGWRMLRRTGARFRGRRSGPATRPREEAVIPCRTSAG